MAKPKGKAKPAKKAAPKKSAKKKAAAPKKKAPAPKQKAAPKKQQKPAPKKAAPKKKPAPRKQPAKQAVPQVIEPQRSGGDVVRILESQDPIGELRTFLSNIQSATVQEGQIALGSAQLMLLPIARGAGRGGPEVKELLDLVLGRWTTFPDRTGFH